MRSPTLTFTSAMFHASLHGTKDTTRRLITPPPTGKTFEPGVLSSLGEPYRVIEMTPGKNWSEEVLINKAPHHPGQIKPMVTNWRVNGSFDNCKPTDLDPESVTRAGGIYWEHIGILHHLGYPDHCSIPPVITPTCQISQSGFSHESKLYPARFLPKSLYPLAPQVEILTVTPEFLHDITEDSALRDGIQSIAPGQFGVPDPDGDFHHQAPTAREAYFKLWDSINAAKEGGQYAAAHNPACWTLTYRGLPPVTA